MSKIKQSRSLPCCNHLQSVSAITGAVLAHKTLRMLRINGQEVAKNWPARPLFEHGPARGGAASCPETGAGAANCPVVDLAFLVNC